MLLTDVVRPNCLADGEITAFIELSRFILVNLNSNDDFLDGSEVANKLAQRIFVLKPRNGMWLAPDSRVHHLEALIESTLVQRLVEEPNPLLQGGLPRIGSSAHGQD